jgi:hypothetical protein
MKLPKVGDFYRFVGKGIANGVLYRVLSSDAVEIMASQEAMPPNWSWLGPPSLFWREFVFVAGPLFSLDAR